MARMNISDESIPGSKIKPQSTRAPAASTLSTHLDECSAKCSTLALKPSNWISSTRDGKNESDCHDCDEKLPNNGAISKFQRPLRKLQHNQVLLERKPSTLDCDTKEKPVRARLLKESVAGVHEEFNTPSRDESSAKGKPAKSKPVKLRLESDSESDDTLAEIEFWTAPRPATGYLNFNKARDESLKTPRSKRIEIRQRRRCEEKEPIDMPKEPNDKALDAKAVPNLPDSRPTSSYGGDPCALLTL
jgi:hypothetical protein